MHTAYSHFIVHLGIYLSVTSSNPSGALSGNCFTCGCSFSHLPSLYLSSSKPSGPLSGNCSTCLILSHAYHIKQPLGTEQQLLHMSYSHGLHIWVFIASHTLLTLLTHLCILPHAYLLLSLFLIEATPREPRAAIASHTLLTLLTHLGILPHACLLCHYF